MNIVRSMLRVQSEGGRIPAAEDKLWRGADGSARPISLGHMGTMPAERVSMRNIRAHIHSETGGNWLALNELKGLTSMMEIAMVESDTAVNPCTQGVIDRAAQVFEKTISSLNDRPRELPDFDVLILLECRQEAGRG